MMEADNATIDADAIREAFDKLNTGPREYIEIVHPKEYARRRALREREWISISRRA